MSLNQSFISDFSESEKNCQAVYQYLVHILSPVTDNCPSWISGRETMVVDFFFMKSPRKNVPGMRIEPVTVCLLGGKRIRPS